MSGLICWSKYRQAYPGPGKVVKYPVIVSGLGGLETDRVIALKIKRK